jgi:hypothetical protein
VNVQLGGSLQAIGSCRKAKKFLIRNGQCQAGHDPARLLRWLERPAQKRKSGKGRNRSGHNKCLLKQLQLVAVNNQL